MAKRLLLAVLLVHATGACARMVQVPIDCPPVPPLPPVPRVRLDGEPGTLRGQLQRSSDGTPVGMATVLLEGTERRVGADSTGAFRFDTLAPGRYAVQIRRVGYDVRRVDSLEVDAGRGTAVIVPLREMPLDGCPGFMVAYERVPWWKIWRW